MRYYITGDIHGDLSRLQLFCSRFKNKEELKDICLIILGDCGFNYYLNKKDIALKEAANNLGITIFNIKGNHELHADQIKSYKLKEWNGAPVYYEEEFPNLLFAKDGEIYDIDGKRTLVIGGAYSIDKYYRLMKGWRWFDTEQPSDEVKRYVFTQLDKAGWEVDVVLSHTAPLKMEPRHLFMSGIDQSRVDKTTEEFLDEISDKLDFKKWYFGHYHGEWKVDKYRLMFNDIEEF